ncbi:MAG TPA: replication-associated recombination protein A [Actinomycetota bacterium]|nr:replication-associated recombination protein A [Actinomycetota bacterium]
MSAVNDDRAPTLFDPEAPLAVRMRPRTLEELAGQQHVVGEGTMLRALIDRDELRSAILWGPPGTGKTTIAHIVAARTSAPVEKLSAVSSGVADVRKVIEKARMQGRTVLFIDEIHRFNRSQQDALLGAVEDGVIVLIGATTENPFFEVNSPLVSRSLLFRLEPLTSDDIRSILRRAMAEPERGLKDVEADDEAIKWVATTCGGDARVALNALEAGAEKSLARGDGRIVLDDAKAAMEKRVVRYDKKGDRHYDVISAFIKSMRGSDPDAALWYLAEMLEAGEDARFIARRMIILASEDIGLADPQALVVAVAAAHALEHVGLPEAQLNLAQGVIYLSLAPKSNAVTRAIGAARAHVREVAAEVPAHLRDASYPGARRLGHGKGYKYPHDYPGGEVEQEYRPAETGGRRYYEPGD